MEKIKLLALDNITLLVEKKLILEGEVFEVATKERADEIIKFGIAKKA